MKKNNGKEKVIRAMAIGISAMLATSTPLTALAADGVDDTEGSNPNEAGQSTKPASDVCDNAQEVASKASEQTGDAKDSAAIIKDDVKNVEVGEAGVDDEGKDLAQGVIDAAKKTEDTTVEGGSSLAEANDAITNTNDQLDTAEANDGLSDAALGKATDAATNAGTIATDVKNAMDEANAKADEQLDEIQNATTITDANAAYDALEATANAAQEEFNTKLEEYNAAKDAYDAAAKKVAEYEKAYNDAIANAATNAEAAKKELEAAQKNAADLEAAVSAAKDAVDASVANAMEIANAEELTQTDSGLNWRNEDKLFSAIMANYYLPEKLGIEGATVTRVQGKDNNEYNYFEVKYVENGETKVKYFNYKMDGSSKDDIVIFEKRDVEVNGGAFDQYVDNDGKVVDTVAGVEDGTVVKVGDEYVIKNDVTGSETLVSNSEITGTSTTDVTIDADTKQESYKLDEEGNLVKTVTADVTTITYTDATFTSDKDYETEAERDKAAEAKKDELEKATGKDATINETEETTYTATETYIPTFTKTVNVKNEEVEWDHTGKWNDAGVKTEAEAVSKVQKAEEKALKKKIENDDEDLYFIGVQSDLAVTGYTEEERGLFGVVTDDSDFLVSGTVTATYAKVTKETIDQSTFGSLWDDIKALIGKGETTNEKLEAAARAAVEADGGIFLGANWVDLKFNKATIRYVKGYKVTSGEKQTEQEAKYAVQELVDKQVTEDGATGVYHTNVATESHTTYSYTVNYLKKDSETTETKAIATETYGNADVLEGQIIQNKNYKDGKILLTQNDEDYRAFVDDAKDITGKYNRLLKEAQKANEDVVAAQNQVVALQEEIKALKEKSNNAASLIELEAKLTIAQVNRVAAEETLNEILDKLAGAGVTLNEVIDRLTPPAPTTEPTAETPVAVPVATPVVATVNTLTPVVVAEIGDEETPLVANTNEVEETKEDEKENEITAIADEETPLAALEENERISWWWWLILLLLGATGYAMYKKHQADKKAAAKADDAE